MLWGINSKIINQYILVFITSPRVVRPCVHLICLIRDEPWVIIMSSVERLTVHISTNDCNDVIVTSS